MRPEEIQILDTDKAWQLFISTIQETEEEVYQKGRWGIKIRFDIYEYLEGDVIIKTKTGKVSIRGRTYDTEDYYTELEERNKLIKNWLIEELTDEGVTKAR